MNKVYKASLGGYIAAIDGIVRKTLVCGENSLLSEFKMEKGSKKDRHAHLGQGEIGLAPFAMLMGDERFAEVPAILETPKDGCGDEGNLAILRKLRGA